MRFVYFTVEEADLLEAIYQKGYEKAIQESKSIAKTMGRKEDSIRGWFGRRKIMEEAGLPGPYNRRKRLTDAEQEYMKKIYQENQRPTPDEVRKIAKKLNTDILRVRKWFSSRRSRDNITIPQRRLSDEQKRNLELFYAKNNCPGMQERNEIAKTIGASEKQIYSWFAAKRLETEFDVIVAKEQFISTVERESKDPPEIAEIDSAKTEILEASYLKQSVPTKKELKQLKDKINIDVKLIELWFSRKRRNVNHLRLKTKQQTDELEEAYQKNKYLTNKEINELGNRIGLKMSQLRVWFKGRRSRDKDFDEHLLVLPDFKLKTPEQSLVLKEAYQKNKFPEKEEMYELADRIGIKRKKVQHWFTAQRKQDKDLDKSLFRRKYHPDRLQMLEAAFQKNSTPSTTEMEDLAKITGLTFNRIRTLLNRFRKRTGCPELVKTYTSHQLDVLLDAYNESPYVNKDRATEIANHTGLTEKRIRNWFKTRRRPVKPKIPLETQVVVKVKTEHVDQKMSFAELESLHADRLLT